MGTRYLGDDYGAEWVDHMDGRMDRLLPVGRCHFEYQVAYTVDRALVTTLKLQPRTNMPDTEQVPEWVVLACTAAHRGLVWSAQADHTALMEWAEYFVRTLGANAELRAACWTLWKHARGSFKDVADLILSNVRAP